MWANGSTSTAAYTVIINYVGHGKLLLMLVFLAEIIMFFIPNGEELVKEILST